MCTALFIVLYFSFFFQISSKLNLFSCRDGLYSLSMILCVCFDVKKPCGSFCSTLLQSSLWKHCIVKKNHTYFQSCLLRWYYTRRNLSGMSRRHRFFCCCTCVKVLFTNAFLKCRFRLKVETISTFPLRTNAAFFLNQSF